jgi:hypothetical protein
MLLVCEKIFSYNYYFGIINLGVWDGEGGVTHVVVTFVTFFKV